MGGLLVLVPGGLLVGWDEVLVAELLEANRIIEPEMAREHVHDFRRDLTRWAPVDAQVREVWIEDEVARRQQAPALCREEFARCKQLAALRIGEDLAFVMCEPCIEVPSARLVREDRVLFEAFGGCLSLAKRQNHSLHLERFSELVGEVFAERSHELEVHKLFAHRELVEQLERLLAGDGEALLDKPPARVDLWDRV